MRLLPIGRDASLFWKVLVPFLVLMVVVGSAGVYLVVHDLAVRTEASLERELASRSLNAQSHLRDQELYLLESATFAANVEGMASASRRRDAVAVAALLQSVLALKSELALAAVADTTGIGIAEFTRQSDGFPPSFGRDTPWVRHAFVSSALSSDEGSKFAGFVESGGASYLALAAPICAGTTRCEPVGVAIVALRAENLLRALPGTSLTLVGRSGQVISAAGDAPGDAVTATVPYEVQGDVLANLRVSIPRDAAAAAVRAAALRIVSIVVVTMIGIIAIGAVLSRSILAQIRPLLETNRALGRGDLGARVPVLSQDELGEVARGVNEMAERLQASYETLELRVSERTEEVRRLLQDRTEFFAGLSHELRTPLAVILTQAAMAHAAEDDVTQRRESLNLIEASARELLAVVNDILDLARAEAGTLEIRPQAMSLGSLLGEVEPTLVGLGRSADVDVTLEVGSETHEVLGDPGRLREVVVNLVDNAVKYTPPGGRVRVELSAADRRVVLAVADTGIGIPAHVGDRIFEPFYRVPGSDPQHRQPSSGLGLAIARRWVEAHGGEITWRSRPTGGTVFEVSLPAEPRAFSKTGSSGKRSRRAHADARPPKHPARAC